LILLLINGSLDINIVWKVVSGVIFYPCGVITFAIFTFSTKNMERYLAPAKAIITHDNHLYIPVQFWHLHIGNLVVHKGLIDLGIYNGLLTERTWYSSTPHEVSKTLWVHRMPASHERRGLGGGVHILQAYWAILLQLSLHTRVTSLRRHSEATLALIAMEEVISSSNPAYSTLFAMEDLFCYVIIIPQVANGAEVACKLHLALIACLSTRLNIFAKYTLNLLHIMSV
jgi:hypothetical protein